MSRLRRLANFGDLALRFSGECSIIDVLCYASMIDGSVHALADL